MDNLYNVSIGDNYKQTLIGKQLKIFSYYFLVGILFSLIFCSVFILERLTHKQSSITITPKVFSENITIKQGATLQTVLSGYKVSYPEILNIIAVGQPKIDLQHLNIGQNVEVLYETSPELGYKNLISLSIQTSLKEKILIEKINGKYELKVLPILFKTSIVKASGVITDNVITSALKAGVPFKNIIEFINYYSYEIDFQRDLRAGDKFQIIYEKVTSEDNKQTIGKTLFANLILKGKEYKMYRFKPLNGQEDFFDENNSSIKKPLLKTPVQSARISSKFGLRKHPILGYSLMHRGIDFAASVGTPIYAAGKGTIVEIGDKGSYGKYVKIKHNNELYTAYAHARGFAKGLRAGSKISQGDTIAYVGMSGRTSGPHLHYEIIHRGQQIDPLKFKLPSFIKLKGADLTQFQKVKLELEGLANKS